MGWCYLLKAAQPVAARVAGLCPWCRVSTSVAPVPGGLESCFPRLVGSS